MLHVPAGPNPLKLQAFLLVDGQMYKSSMSHASDAFRGRRAEPALAGKVARIYSARLERGVFSFGDCTVVAFDDKGLARTELVPLRVASVLSGRPLRDVMSPEFDDDTQVRAFIEAYATEVGPGELQCLAQNARLLPKSLSRER